METTETSGLQSELQERLIGSIDKVSQWVDSAEGFAAEHAPGVAKEILMWGFWSNLFWAALVSSFFIATGVILWWAWRWLIKIEKLAKNRDIEDFVKGDAYVAATVAALLGSLVQVVLMVCFVPPVWRAMSAMIMTCVAPRLYIVEYLKEVLQ